MLQRFYMSLPADLQFLLAADGYRHLAVIIIKAKLIRVLFIEMDPFSIAAGKFLLKIDVDILDFLCGLRDRLHHGIELFPFSPAVACYQSLRGNRGQLLFYLFLASAAINTKRRGLRHGKLHLICRVGLDVIYLFSLHLPVMYPRLPAFGITGSLICQNKFSIHGFLGGDCRWFRRLRFPPRGLDRGR